MNRLTGWVPGGLLLAALMLLSGCGMTGEQLAYDELEHSDEDADIIQQLTDLRFEIEMMATDSTCNFDAECQTIAVGNRPCGGADSYYAYSSSTTDVTQLMDMVAGYNRLERKLQHTPQQQAECHVISDPGARCADERCILNYIPR